MTFDENNCTFQKKFYEKVLFYICIKSILFYYSAFSLLQYFVSVEVYEESPAS